MRDETAARKPETLIFEVEETQQIWAERALHGFDLLEPLETGEFQFRAAPSSRLELKAGLLHVRQLPPELADRLLELFEARCPRLFRLRDRFATQEDLDRLVASLPDPDSDPEVGGLDGAPRASVYDSGLQRQIMTVAAAFDGYLRSVEQGQSRVSEASARRVLDRFESYLVLRGAEDLLEEGSLPGPFTLTVPCQVLLQAGPYFVQWCEQAEPADLDEVRDVVEALLVWLGDRRKVEAVELQEARQALRHG